MPKRILLIGLLFCLGGVQAIWSILVALSHSQIHLNFAAFLLPVGIGLLRGKTSSRWWARFWIILGYVSCGFLAIIVLLFPGAARFNCFGQITQGTAAVPYVIGISAVVALLFFGLHKLLYSKKASEFFDSRSN